MAPHPLLTLAKSECGDAPGNGRKTLSEKP